VIVSCPSCGARYRVEAARGSDRGCCSACGSEVPIVSAPRSYVLRAATAGGVPWVGDRGGARAPQAAVSPQALVREATRPSASVTPATPYDPWTETSASQDPSLDVAPRNAPAPTGSAGSPLLPALLAVVGALLGYWAGAQGLVGDLPVVSAAGPAGLAALGASLGLLAGWAGDRWIVGR
jgi:hypothetical protein